MPDGAPGRGDLVARLTIDAGLCLECLHLRLVASSRSVFVRCGWAEVDPSFPRYPPLPVRACRGFQPAGEASEP